MINEESNIKIQELLDMKNQIENKLKFLEENFEDLSDSQIDEMMQLSLHLEECLHPEIDAIKAEIERNKEEFLNKGHNFKKD